MTFPPDWSEFIALLCSSHVRFVIVGAHALAANGVPRATGDLDVFVEPTKANARRLGLALHAFGFVDLAREAAQFAESDRMAKLGREPLRNRATGGGWPHRRRGLMRDARGPRQFRTRLTVLSPAGLFET